MRVCACWGGVEILIESSYGLLPFLLDTTASFARVGSVGDEEGGVRWRVSWPESAFLRSTLGLAEVKQMFRLISELGASAFLSMPLFAWGSCPTTCPDALMDCLELVFCTQ